MMYFILMWIILVFLGMPLAFSLGIVSMAFLLFNGVPLDVMIQKMAAAPDSFTFLAIPFFVLAGKVMNTSGITNRIFEFARSIVGHITGGLGHVNVIASIIFSGMSGSAVADAAGLGAMEIKAMMDNGYDPEFSAGVTLGSAAIGPIIPPSIPIVILGVLANISIGRLFIGGIIPGLLMGLFLMLITYLIARKRGYSKDERPSIKKIWTAFKKAFLALITPLIIMGGIMSGIFTPTEAAIITVFYALFIAGVVYREITINKIGQVLLETVKFSAGLTFVVATANLFGWILTREQIPQQVAQVLLSITENPLLILLIINLFVLFLGCFMEGLAIMMILVPLLMPVILRLGISPVQFGVTFVLNLMIGHMTPPFGITLFIASDIAGIPFHRVVKGVIPFLSMLLVVLFLIIIFPNLVTFLPNLLLG